MPAMEARPEVVEHRVADHGLGRPLTPLQTVSCEASKSFPLRHSVLGDQGAKRQRRDVMAPRLQCLEETLMLAGATSPSTEEGAHLRITRPTIER